MKYGHGKPSAYLAFLLDYFIQVACIGAVGLVLHLIGLLMPMATASRIVIPIFLTSVFLILFGYWPFFKIACKGYTPGRVIVGFPKP